MQKLCEGILAQDDQIWAAYLIGVPEGAVLGESVRSQYAQELAHLAQLNNGMAAVYGVRAFAAMQRLDDARSKIEYLVIVRERLKGMILPAPNTEERLFVVLTFDKKGDATAIYERVIKYFAELQLR